MRADKLVMLGVGAMGLYVVYRMFKTDGKVAQTTENLAPAPAAPGALVENPRAVGVRLDPRQVLTNPTTLLLKAQTAYRMRLELAGGLPPFAETSNDRDIQAALKQLGFVEAQVFRTPPENFPGDATQNPGPGTRFVIAQWGPTTMSVSRPKAVALIWQTKVPGT